MICCEWIVWSGTFSAYPTVSGSIHNLFSLAPVVAFVMIPVGGSWIHTVVLLLTWLTSSFGGWLTAALARLRDGHGVPGGVCLLMCIVVVAASLLQHGWLHLSGLILSSWQMRHRFLLWSRPSVTARLMIPIVQLMMYLVIVSGIREVRRISNSC